MAKKAQAPRTRRRVAGELRNRPDRTRSSTFSRLREWIVRTNKALIGAIAAGVLASVSGLTVLAIDKIPSLFSKPTPQLTVTSVRITT